MANQTATVLIKTTYVNTEGATLTPSATVAAPYSLGAQAVTGIDVPDLAAANTEYSVAFSSVAAATAVVIDNQTGQDIAVRFEGGSVTGTLVSGTATIAFPGAAGERLWVERTAGNGGTNGKLYVERSSGNVIVTSYYASGVQTADVSSVKVYNNAPPAIANLGAVAIAMPAAATGQALTAAKVILTAEQDGLGAVGVKVFGDPV
jgi:hypothetical protein